MSLLGLLPGVLKTIGRVLGLGAATEVGKALENLQIPPEKQAELRLALLSHEADMKQLNIDEMKQAMSESLAMIQSSDKFVSRARPTGLYIFYTISAALAIGMIFGVKIDPAAILTILSPLAGVGGLYVYKRTQEKVNGNGNGD